MAEWLRRGLQILARRFDSGSGLHSSARFIEISSFGVAKRAERQLEGLQDARQDAPRGRIRNLTGSDSMNTSKILVRSLIPAATSLIAIAYASPAAAQGATCGTYAAGTIIQPAQGVATGPLSTACG